MNAEIRANHEAEIRHMGMQEALDFGAMVGEAAKPQALPLLEQVVADGSDSNSTNVALGYAQGLVASYSRDLLVQQRGLAKAPAPPIDARIRVWFNPQLESRVFMIPGTALTLASITVGQLVAAYLAFRHYPETAHLELEQLNPEDPRISES